ncbi:MAG: hypothetical protein ABWZ66_05280 [Pyrinomonadaceae bacterium]
MAERTQDIINACENNWEANKSDCNKFVRAVGAALGIDIVAGNADAIIDSLTAPTWTPVIGGIAAKQKADEGFFVIAGLKAAAHTPPRTNGHVAVVVAGPLDPTHNKYPTGYWGSLGSIGKKNTTLNYSWNTADRDNVKYFYRALP